MTSNRRPIHQQGSSCKPPSWSSEEQYVELRSAPPSTYLSLYTLRASVREATHASHKFFRSCVLLLTCLFHVSWKHDSPALTAKQALPTFLCPLSSPPPARRCTWTSNPPCPLHHTESGTARTSLKRPSSVPPRIHHIRHHFQSVRVGPAPQQLNLCFRKRCFRMSALVCFFSSPFLASPPLHLLCGVSFHWRPRICFRPLLFF